MNEVQRSATQSANRRLIDGMGAERVAKQIDTTSEN